MLDGECVKQIDAWSQKLTAIRNKLDLIRQRTVEHMRARGIKKIVSTTGRSITLVNNGGIQRVLYDPEAVKNCQGVPEEFVKVITSKVPDGDKVRKALEDGVDLPFASLMARGQHVRFNT